MMTQLELARVTPSSKGGFINTWKSVASIMVATPLGNMLTTANRYCTKSSNQLAVGTKADVDLDNFLVQESAPFIGSDGKQHTTKWLRLK